MVDQVFSRVHVAMGLRMILTLEKWFTASTFQFVEKRGKKKEKIRSKKYQWIRLLEMLYNTCNRFIKLMMLPRVLSESYIIISAVLFDK